MTSLTMLNNASAYEEYTQTTQQIAFTHPLILAWATCSGSDAKYGEPLDA